MRTAHFPWPRTNHPHRTLDLPCRRPLLLSYGQPLARHFRRVNVRRDHLKPSTECSPSLSHDGGNVIELTAVGGGESEGDRVERDRGGGSGEEGGRER